MKNIKVVAFDCDGVMFDTIELNKSYYNHLLSQFNQPLMTEAQLNFVHMHTVDESMAHLFDEQQLQEVQAFRKSMDYMPFLKYMQIEPYLKPLLKRLRPHYKTAIATNRTDTMDFVLANYDLTALFDLVVTAKDVSNPKPHPEPLNKILQHFNCIPDEAIYIGDSELDQIAALASGVRFIAYNNRSLQADYHITALNEIKTILAL
ncbi:HAD-IA family hydrolase [Desulfococcaceae bacterium HSG9]|nr:HAD-IA family hydrolase [Desulfococcaceae bacterium HSG9]